MQNSELVNKLVFSSGKPIYYGKLCLSEWETEHFQNIPSVIFVSALQLYSFINTH